jgi:hypothetical protein
MQMADDKSFVKLVGNALSAFFTGRRTDAPSTELRPDPTLGLYSFLRTARDMYAELSGLSGSRADKYDQYLYLDKNLAEAAASLNVYADNVVSGTVGGDENYYVMIDEDAPDIDELEDIVDAAEKQTEIKDMIWEIARSLNRDGDVFQEVIITKDDSEMYIDRIKPLPTKEMVALVDERGNFKNPEVPYAQTVAGTTEPIPFDWWRVVHFKVGNGVYGVDNSLFANAALRHGRQLIWVDEAMVLARLSRAWQRNAYLIDTGKMGPDDALSFVEKFMSRLRSQRVVADKTTGRTSLMDAPLLPDEDVGIPVGEGSKADVKQLSGDVNVGNIKDVEYLQNKFLIAVTVPKAYIALEQDINAKATLGYIDIQFARQVRRRQKSLVPGLREFYRLVFSLAGKDPDSFDWDIEFPELATSDEQLKWQTMAVKADIAKILTVDVGAVNNEFIYRELMGWDDEEIEKYAAVLPSDDTPDDTTHVQLPPGLANAVRRDPEVRAMLGDLRDIITTRYDREERRKGKKRIGTERKKALACAHDEE